MKNQDLILKTYSISLTFILGYFLLSSFKQGGSTQVFDEISVERINIVEPDGSVKMVISNGEKQHPGMMDGIVLQERKRSPGIIFFNEEQDEVGGLIYSGSKEDGASILLSFDQYKNDQVMQMQYLRGKSGKQQYGLRFWDRTDRLTMPQLKSIIDSISANGGITSEKQLVEELESINKGEPITATRMFTGKTVDEEVGLFIADNRGNRRINISVDKDNNPIFRILDEEGKVIKDLILD